MKFIINKHAIVDVLSKIQGLTGRKSNLAITENVLIRATESGLTIAATDLETGFEGSYASKVEKTGAIAISARKFFEIVREFPSEEILINEIENRWIEIGNKKVLYHIVSMNPDDFPDTPYIEEVTFFPIDSLAFKKMIEKSVLISGAGDDKRAHINGVFFERIFDGESAVARMVSTDGSRLSTVDYRYENRSDLPTGEGVLIPKKGLNEVGKFLDSEGTVQIALKDSYFIVKKDDETLIIRLLEGEFPKYQDIIKKEDVYTIKIEKQVFRNMLKRMSILATDNYKGVIFNFNRDELVITATNPDIGESKEDMPIHYEGGSIEAAFNPKFFIDTLNVIEDDHVNIHIKDEEKPCIIEGEIDPSYVSVIMPMRI
jgi:DNA polymerase-3 subunit beta